VRGDLGQDRGRQGFAGAEVLLRAEVVARGLDHVIGSCSPEHLDGFGDHLRADSIAADDRNSSASPHARDLSGSSTFT